MSRRASPELFRKAIDPVLLARLEELFEEITAEFHKLPARHAFGCAPAYLSYEVNEALARVSYKWRTTRNDRGFDEK